MFVKRVFHLLFLTIIIIYAENVNGIGVQPPPPHFNLTVDATNVTAPTIFPSTTHKPSIVTTSLITKSTVIHNPTETSATPKPTPVHINHDRTPTPVSTTNTPLTSSTTQPSTTTKIVVIETSTAKIDAPKSGSDVIHTSTEKSTTKDESVTIQSTVPSTTTTTDSSITTSTQEANGHSKTTAAGIVALICVTCVSFGFVALIAWRYVYRKKHGNREILINEEDVDFNDEDLRHFELKLLNSDGKVIQA